MQRQNAALILQHVESPSSLSVFYVVLPLALDSPQPSARLLQSTGGVDALEWSEKRLRDKRASLMTVCVTLWGIWWGKIQQLASELICFSTWWRQWLTCLSNVMKCFKSKLKRCWRGSGHSGQQGCISCLRCPENLPQGEQHNIRMYPPPHTPSQKLLGNLFSGFNYTL